ncbi:olfactory receptor 5V1-like [Lissotriton helveticus]
MTLDNITFKDGFFIVGFSDLPQLQVPLFVSFLFIYIMSLAGNLLVMTIIYSSANLHTPMYFFLTHLSFLEISYTSVIFPQMLAHFFLQGSQITLPRCLLQMYFFIVMVSTEFLLLTVMAYDRYVAICSPLRYMIVMNKTVCIQLAAGSWLIGVMDALPHTILISKFSFCDSHTINHFFCDLTALIRISCTDTEIIEIFTVMLGVVLALISFLLIITSYVNIITAILKIQSAAGRGKAFSTCASHLTVVILFYGSLCSTYMRPISTYSIKTNKIMSLTYTALTPLFNPIIYSLKNEEFKHALKKTQKWI